MEHHEFTSFPVNCHIGNVSILRWNGFVTQNNIDKDNALSNTKS